MDIIHLLPDSVANQIAAGEVIQRPASCLKELVENALDAGAQHIEVLIRDAGRTLLQVIDDGKGMSGTDARMAFERHATSKIREAADLYNLHTMGFRGEALASIAAVAQVELLTRRPEDEIGTLLEIAASQVVRQEPAQANAGTSIKVKNLFYNLPARRRFLKTNATELRNIITDFQRIVLVYPDIHFTLINDDEILFDLPVGSLKQRIEAVFGKSLKKGFANQLIDVHTQSELLKINGYIGLPEAASKNAQQYFFVNGRFMKHPYFHKAVQTAYSGMLLPEHNPSYFLYFDIDPSAIDVNIHPAKTEIKFADEQIIWQILLAALRESLGKFNVTPSIDFDREGDISIPAARQHTENVDFPRTQTDTRYNPFHTHTAYQPHFQQWEKLYPERMEETSAPPMAEPAPLFEIPAIDLDVPVTQYKEKYLLLPATDGIMLIDQHRAHICVLYEELHRHLQNRQGVMQQVLFPDVIDLSTEESNLLQQLQEDLHFLGFDITQIAKNSFSVDGVPAELQGRNASEILLNILHSVKETGSNTQHEWEQSVILSLAQDAAIQQGKHLSETESKDLLQRFFALKENQFTPDGKRVVTLINDEEISKRMK